MASVLKHSTDSTAAHPDPATFSGLASVNLKDFVESGLEQVQAAKQEAMRILEEAKQQAKQLREKVTQEAKTEGLRLARQDFDKQVDQAARKIAAADSATLNESVAQLWRSETAWLEQWQQTLAALALEIAEKIIIKRIENDETIVLDWAKQAIELTRTARSITVSVHPETLVRIGEQLEMLLRESGGPDDSRLEPDETVSLHGVVVRQEGGKVDMQLRSQIDRLRTSLK